MKVDSRDRMAEKTDIISNQKGASVIAVIAIMLILAVMGAALVSLVTTGSDISVNQLQSEQALFAAESGLEHEQRSLAQNLEWYRSTSDPIATTTLNLGDGSFTVSSNLPATMIRTRIPNNTSTTPIRVYTTNRFPVPPTCSPCYIQIEDDISGSAEFVQYTNIIGDTFAGTISRNVTIGTIAGTAGSHERGSTVYPVTTLSTALGTLGSPCAEQYAASFNIVAHNKFLSAGIIDIEGEEIRYASSSTSGTVMTLNGVTRCLNLTSSAHPIGRPVTPVLIGGDLADYQAEIVSSGNVSSARRVISKTIQR
jgi:Tfp pilus assembly protein PilX